mgnify:CR=1 FL=1
MAAPDKVIINGTGPVLHDWDFKESVTGPDEITFTAQNCSARTTYAKGSTVPGYSTMLVIDTHARLVPGSQYDIQVHARGLLSGSSRIIKRSNSTDPFGFDTIQESRMELKTTTVPVFGAVHSTEPYCRFMSASEDESLDLGDGTSSWVMRQRTYKGIIGSINSKLVQRKITNNGNVVSLDDLITAPLPGGWTTARKAQISFPRIVVSDTRIELVPPDTYTIFATATPVNAPPVYVLDTISGDLTWNFPSGWRISNRTGQELYLGAGIWSNTIDYEFVWPAQF